MTSIGTQRKMDSLGRIVIPKEFRNFFNMQDCKTRLEICNAA